MGQLGREAGRCSLAPVVGAVGADDVEYVVAVGDILVAVGGAAVAAGSDVVHVVVVAADEAAVDEAVVVVVVVVVVGTASVVDLYIAVVAAAVVVVVVVLDVAGKIFVVSAAFVGTACQSHIPRQPLVTPHAAGPD